MEVMIKIQTNLNVPLKTIYLGFDKDLRRQYISILESFEPVFITDESTIQREQNHRDELAGAILNSRIEADIIRELVDTSSTEWKVTALR